MNTLFTIAAEEWRYWSRTKLGAVVTILSLVLVVISVFASLNQQASQRDTRESLQIKAEQTFRDQPDRHPHRMVHYGHYVFKVPTRLAALDPGVDPYTGNVMFLEGHRQNSATFSPSYDAARAGSFSRLTPALAYQLLVPLVLIVIGFAVVAREREFGTDRQLVTSGITPTLIWLGKTIAMLSVVALMMLPLLIGIVFSKSALSISLAFFAIHAFYLVVWVLIITAVSAWSNTASSSLLILLTLWVSLCVLVPRVVANLASTTVPSSSQIETDMNVLVALRDVGDGHNANDPAFQQLKANLLNEYGVERIEDLPINFRGVVAHSSEAKLTEIMNDHAEKRMNTQVAQVDRLKALEFMSPFLVLQSASMVTAGSDVKTHHRFLREAETVRFEFIQGLNQAHIKKLNYVDDINRSKDENHNQRARVDAENWNVLNDFRFQADSSKERVSRLGMSFLILFLWMFAFFVIGFLGARRLSEVA